MNRREIVLEALENADEHGLSWEEVQFLLEDKLGTDPVSGVGQTAALTELEELQDEQQAIEDNEYGWHRSYPGVDHVLWENEIGL